MERATRSSVLAFVLLVFLAGCIQNRRMFVDNPTLLADSCPGISENGIVFNAMSPDNPFSPYPGIRYYVEDSAQVTLIITNIDGVPVDTVLNLMQGPGLYEARYVGDFGGLGPGVYLWELHTFDYVETGPLFCLYCEKKDEREQEAADTGRAVAD